MAPNCKELLIFPQVTSFIWTADSLVSPAKACLSRTFMNGKEQWTLPRSLAFTYLVSSSASVSSLNYSLGTPRDLPLSDLEVKDIH